MRSARKFHAVSVWGYIISSKQISVVGQFKRIKIHIILINPLAGTPLRVVWDVGAGSNPRMYIGRI